MGKHTGVRLAWLVCFAGLGVSAASAQTNATAEALFQDGRRLARKGDHAAACAKFAASDKLEPSVGARIQLGKCNEAQGKTATAWGSYKAAQSLASRIGDSRRAAIAKKEATRIEPRLTYVTLEAPETLPEGLSVSFDGEDKPVALLGTRFPVDPGSHSVEVKAPGYMTATQTIELAQGDAPRTVELPALRPATEPDPPEPPDPDPDPDPGDPGDDGDDGDDEPVAAVSDSGGGLGGRRWMAIGIGAAGLAAIGAGSYFGIQSFGHWADAEDLCDDELRCSTEGLQAADDAESAANLANIFIGGGVAIVAGAAVLWLISGDDGGEATVAPTAGRDRVGLAVTGWF